MGRKKGFDEKKISSIVSYLARNPDGVWLRNIARDLALSPGTVAKYVDDVLQPLVENTRLGSSAKPLLRVIRLKPAVLDELEKGKDLQQIMKILKMMSSYK